MDRMVQTALNSMKMLMENQVATAHNLSNLSTPGFKQDVVTDFSSIYLNRQEGLEPRIVAAREVGKFSVEQGMLDNTKNPFLEPQYLWHLVRFSRIINVSSELPLAASLSVKFSSI